MLAQIRVPISERSEIGAARRAAAEMTEAHGFDAIQTGKAGLCVTEAATNIVKHAGRGQILLRVLERAGVYGLEMLALDRGPGIANLTSSMRDGVSTAGSSGNGLGALARSSECFEIYSPLGKGTAVRLEIWARPVPAAAMEIGAVCLPMSGQVVSGDAWAEQIGAQGSHAYLVADGLGHGTEAARASIAAVNTFAKRPGDEPSQVIEACHRALVPTRGAAVAVGSLQTGTGKGAFAGVGNIACRVEGGSNRRQLVSHNGTLGHNLRRLQQFDFEFGPDALLIFHSDGLATHWNLADYPGLVQKHAGVIAGVLYRDHERGRDDVTVLVVRNGTVQ